MQVSEKEKMRAITDAAIETNRKEYLENILIRIKEAAVMGRDNIIVKYLDSKNKNILENEPYNFEVEFYTNNNACSIYFIKW